MKRKAGASAPPLCIIAGKWKRRRLEAPSGARPTSGRAREALFSILTERIVGARVLDLYAGSGAVGLEAASRGAQEVVLVERESRPLARTIERLAPASGCVRLVSGDVVSALEALRKEGERFDIAFVDPPYATGEDALSLALAARLLSPGGLLILQRDAGQRGAAPEGAKSVARREYGRNVFFFFDF
jgi:16S rRNA (guanine966-N2)-methyltransferase